MRVCILTTSFPAYKGHFQSPFIYRLAQTLVKEKIEVHVVCPYYQESKSAEEIIDGIHIHRFSFWFTRKGQRLVGLGGIPSSLKSSFIAKLQLPLFIISFYLKSRRWVKGCDIIHAQWALSGLIGVWLKKKFNIPLVLTERGAAANIAMKNPFMTKVLIDVLMRSDYVTANNKSQIEMFKGLSIKNNNLAVVPNGFDLDEFKPRDKAKARKNLGLPAGKDIILFVGWLIERKGCNYLIDAMKKVVSKHPKSFLVIVGEGELADRLKKQSRDLGLSESVLFAGSKSPEEIPQYMDAADIFVLPSLSEGRPNVVGEAMASGLPVIATDVSGTPEFIEDGKDGILVKSKDSAALADKIIKLLNDGRKMSEMGRAARKSIIDKGLTWDSCAKDYIRIYKVICAK